MTVSLIEEAAAVREQHQDEYLVLARRVALGEEITPEQVDSACTRAGKQFGEFQSLVRQLKDRQRLRERAAMLRTVEDRYAVLREVCTCADLELQRAKDHHAEVTVPARREIETLVRQLGEICTIPTTLIRSCPDTSLMRRVKQIERDEQTLSDKIRDLTLRIEENQIRLRDEVPHTERAKFSEGIDKLRKHLADLHTKAAELRTERERVTHEMETY